MNGQAMYPEYADAALRERFRRRMRDNAITAATVVTCALAAVCLNPPHRFDLWVAELAGTAIVIGAAPLVLSRVFRVREASLLLGSAVVAALLMVSPDMGDRGMGQGMEATAPVRAGQPLPTASDGFGAYTRDHSDSQKPITHSL